MRTKYYRIVEGSIGYIQEDWYAPLPILQLYAGSDYEDFSVIVELCKRSPDTDEMMCMAEQLPLAKGETNCGKHCFFYTPCNGKSGRCRHLFNNFVGTGRFFFLTKTGLIEIEGER